MRQEKKSYISSVFHIFKKFWGRFNVTMKYAYATHVLGLCFKIYQKYKLSKSLMRNYFSHFSARCFPPKKKTVMIFQNQKI